MNTFANPSPTSLARVLLAASLALAPAVAQSEELDAVRVESNDKIVKALVKFARRATTNKMPSRARVAWQMIVDEYDGDHKAARKALGFKSQDGAWVQTTPDRELDGDEADSRKRATVEKTWRKTRESVAELHRDFAEQLKEGGYEDLARAQFERVLAFAPQDKDSHIALGHKSIDGFYGTAEEIDLARRLQGLLLKASEIAESKVDVERLGAEAMPDELKATGLAFFGARSEHFTHWVVDSQEEADAGVQWAERGYAMLGEILGSNARYRRANRLSWIAIVRDAEQRKVVFEKSPTTLGRLDLSQALMFAGGTFAVRGGNAGLYLLDPNNDADHAVAHVTKMHFLGGRNAGLGEGLVHAMTWLLCGSTLTHYADIPKTVGDDFEPLQPDPEVWRKRLDEEIRSGEDWQLVQLPRERYDNFREGARIKSWSFMVFLLARFPDRWYRLIDRLGTPETIEDVETVFREELGLSTAEVDELWRDWAEPGSALGRVSGW